MKKQTFFILFIVFMLGMCFACSDDKLSGPKEKGINSFTKEDAKKLFETKATNLLSVSLARESHATSRGMENNTPDWSKAETRITDQSIVIEVPMESNSVSRVFQKEWSAVGQQNRITAAFMKLIVAQRNGGNKEMFVVTFIPDCLTPRFVHNLEQNMRYYGGTFSGILLCSDLDGTLRTAFRYVNGVNKGELVFGYKSELGEDYQPKEGDVVIRINNFIATRSFGDDESFVGGGGLCEHQKDPFTCNFCNGTIGEVTVMPEGRFCTGCHRFLHSQLDCICCRICKQWPCSCVCDFCGFKPCRCNERCPICDKIPCVHPCDYCKKSYCHGQCKIGSGGLPDKYCTHTKCQICGGCIHPEYPICQECNCCNVMISSSVSPEVPLMTTYSIDISITPLLQFIKPIIPLRCKYQISRQGTETWYTLYEGIYKQKIERVARTSGNWKIRTVVWPTAIDSVISNSINIEEVFPNYDEIVANSDVVTIMNEVWNETKKALTPATREEKACWIYLDTRNGNYTRGVIKAGAQTPNTINTHSFVSYFAPSDIVPYMTPIDPGAKVAVAFLHTHTSTFYLPRDLNRNPVGPSPKDISMGKDFVGIVYDYIQVYDSQNGTSGGIYGTYPVNSPAKPYHFGLDRMPTTLFGI